MYKYGIKFHSFFQKFQKIFRFLGLNLKKFGKIQQQVLF